VSRTVLIIDEDVNARIIAETLLRIRGLPVRAVMDATEACHIIQREDVAVVVLDLSLPGTNGVELLRRLRSRSGAPRLTSEPSIVVVTSRKEPELERFALRLGAAAFLRKPLRPGQFIATVEALAGTPAEQQAIVATQ
jgi:CheY-like chemotaxis protein